MFYGFTRNEREVYNYRFSDVLPIESYFRSFLYRFKDVISRRLRPVHHLPTISIALYTVNISIDSIFTRNVPRSA